MNMNDMILNKNDELKYLILMREEFYKYKLKLYFFRKWKSRALYNHDLIDEDDPFQNNDSEVYQNFKNLNYVQQGTNFESKGSNEIINKNNSNNNNYESRIGNNTDLLIFDDEDKKNENNINNSNKFENGKIFDLINSKLTFGQNSKNSFGFNSSKNQNNDNDINIINKKNSLDQLNTKKSDIIKLEDSIKVLDVQKNINDALYNTNDVLLKLNSTYKGQKDNNEINNFNNSLENKSNTYKDNVKDRQKLLMGSKIKNKNNDLDKNEQYNKILNSIERLKKNAINGDKLNNNENDEKNDYDNVINNFNDLLIKTNNEDNENNNKNNINIINSSSMNRKIDNFNILQKKINNQKFINNKIQNKNSKSPNKNKEEGNKNNKSGNIKKFDIKKLYKYPSKENYDEEIKAKYKNSKYISTKYKDYLHNGDKSLNNKKSNNLKQKNKLNDLYKEIQKNLESDETLLRRLELKREISTQNYNQIKNNNRNKSKNKRDKSADMVNNIKNNNKQKKYFKYDNSMNIEENLLNNGFFSGKNKKNENNEKENNVDEYPDKIKEIIEKYQNTGKIKEKKPEKKYDYIKKIKAREGGLYGAERFLTNKNYNDINNFKNNENEYDDGYDELFHPNNNKRIINQNPNINQINTSDYSNSFCNLINNIDSQRNNYGYDDLINSINEPKYNRINKRKISRISKKGKKSLLNYDPTENSRYNNNFILAPMKAVPITNISFRARMKYFSDKRQQKLEKMIKAKKEEEKQIYTFQPKTSDNRLNVVKYDYDYINTENNNNKKRMPDYNRINNLYLDYKDKKAKLDDLTKEYYKKAGISFTPKIKDKNKEIKEFKNKVGQIPYLHRIDIYNASQKNIYPDNIIYNQTEIY